MDFKISLYICVKRCPNFNGFFFSICWGLFWECDIYHIPPPKKKEKRLHVLYLKDTLDNFFVHFYSRLTFMVFHWLSVFECFGVEWYLLHIYLYLFYPVSKLILLSLNNDLCLFYSFWLKVKNKATTINFWFFITNKFS